MVAGVAVAAASDKVDGKVSRCNMILPAYQTCSKKHTTDNLTFRNNGHCVGIFVKKIICFGNLKREKY